MDQSPKTSKKDEEGGYDNPPDWLLLLLIEHYDFGCEQEQAQIPTLGFI